MDLFLHHVPRFVGAREREWDGTERKLKESFPLLPIVGLSRRFEAPSTGAFDGPTVDAYAWQYLMAVIGVLFCFCLAAVGVRRIV